MKSICKSLIKNSSKWIQTWIIGRSVSSLNTMEKVGGITTKEKNIVMKEESTMVVITAVIMVGLNGGSMEVSLLQALILFNPKTLLNLNNNLDLEWYILSITYNS